MIKLFPGQNITSFEDLKAPLPQPDKPQPPKLEVSKSQTADQRRTPYDDMLDEIFKQHAPHLSFFEKIQLALAYADIAQNLRAGRVGFLQKSFLHKKTGKILKQAYGRRRDRAMRRYRGRRPPNKRR